MGTAFKFGRTVAGLAVAGVSAFVIATPAAGAVVSWQPSVDMYQGATVETFVNTSGDGVLAVNGTTATTGSVTVNGVAFANVDGATLGGSSGYTAGGVTVKTSTVQTSILNSFQDGGFSGNSAIFDLIAGAVYGDTTVTLSGLTPGQQYSLQVFTNDARTTGGRGSNWKTGFSDGVNSFAASLAAGTAGTSNLNNLPAGDAAGDSITGTFTADLSGSQSFEVRGTRDNFATLTGSSAQLNAFQLRTVVPEPASLVAVAAGGLMLRRRRRAR